MLNVLLTIPRRYFCNCPSHHFIVVYLTYSWPYQLHYNTFHITHDIYSTWLILIFFQSHLETLLEPLLLIFFHAINKHIHNVKNHQREHTLSKGTHHQREYIYITKKFLYFFWFLSFVSNLFSFTTVDTNIKVSKM